MPESEPNPQQILALVLGASSFRRAPKLAQGRPFYNSARDFYEYLTGSEGLRLAGENVNWLFDDSRSPSDQLQDIRDFLESRFTAIKNEGVQLQDLIFYYVGHGLFSGADHTYCLAIRATDERNEGLTSIRASDLASIIRDSARFVRKFLILDCCFSAAAYKEFQSGPLTAGRTKLLDELPQRGTTLLCSASAQDPSLAPEGLSRTMFSDSLLKALRQGHPFFGPRLSLSELGDLVKRNIREAYPNNWVRPEVHSPDQREGDVASVPLFPNAAYFAQKAAEEVRQKDEAQKMREEAEARERAEVERKAREAEEARQEAEAQRTRQEAEVQERMEAERQARRPQKKQDQASHKAEAWARERTETDSVLKPVTAKELISLSGHSDRVTSVAWRLDGKRLATGSADKTTKVWDAETGEVLLTLSGHKFGFSIGTNGVAWRPDGKRLATVGNDGTAKVWDAETGKELLRVKDMDAESSVAWRPDGKHLATAGVKKAKVWDAETGKALLALSGHGFLFNIGVCSVAWSPDGRRLATGGVDKVAKVWDAKTGDELLTLSGHGDRVNSVAWSPDGTRLATGSSDETAKVWDAEIGKKLLTVLGHVDPVLSVAWTPDSTRLATGSSDETAKVWDAKTGEQLLIVRDTAAVNGVAWSPDGKRLATASEDGTATVWEVSE